jgi:hypothetical protein
MKERFLQTESCGGHARMYPDNFRGLSWFCYILSAYIRVHLRFVFLFALIRVHSCQFAVALFGFGCGFGRFRFNKNFYVAIY